jgi:hypothetical protein
MTYRELYDSALRIVSETDGNFTNEDYEERAGYILAAFCGECASIDKKYRSTHGSPESQFVPKALVALNESFPLESVFVPAAVYYLGAMLVSDENEALCDRLFALYTDAISAIQAEIPWSNQKIVNHYPDMT